MNCEDFFFIAEFQWFFMALSVLPFNCLVKLAHWLPRFLWRRKRVHSSLILHYSLLISGFKWLCHLSLHCFPMRPELIERYPAYSKRLLSISELHTLPQVSWDINLPQESRLFYALNDGGFTLGAVFLVVIVGIVLIASKPWRGRVRLLSF